MKIFVAGATGVVGRLLLPQLLKSGHEVFGMTRLEERKSQVEATGAHAVVVDVLDRSDVMSVLDQVRPDVVIHQLTSLSQRNFADNALVRVTGTQNLVDAAMAVGVTRVIAQSIAWAYEPGVTPATESVPLDHGAASPRKELIESVSTLEDIVSQVPDHVILRYGAFYGQGTFYDHGGFVAQQVQLGKVPATEGVTSFVHVADAAHAAALALEFAPGPVNIVDDEPARGTDWLPVYAAALGARHPDAHQGRQGHEGWERGASNAKARNEYGWIPTYPTWRTGLAESLHLTSR